MCKSRQLGVLSAALITLTVAALSAPARASVILTIPGTDNPWLAGQPNGATSGTVYPIPYDSAPKNSPAQYPFPINPFDIFQFSATGATSTDGEGFHFTSRSSPNPDGSENGIGNITAPVDALIGVFLDAGNPATEGTPPPPLNFGTNASLDFTNLTPALNQPFFIGNGTTSGGVTQTFVAPAGATRLFFGPMDQYNWSDNLGQFVLTATDLTTVSTGFPEPTSLSLLAFGALGILRRRRHN